MKEWFESWFDTEFYHILYENRNFSEAERFILSLVEKLSINSNDEVLDLACGRGRHSIFLDSLGFKTTGVDLSPANIEYAKKNGSESLEFFVHDMREPLANKQYDIVLNLFTSFGYFPQEENLKVLNSIYSYLKPGGKLVIDYLNADKVARDLKEDFSKELAGIEFHITKRVVGDHIIKTIKFETEGVQKEYEEKVSLLGQADFEALFDQTHFKIEGIYGDYDLNDFQADSDRLILVAHKE